MPDRGWSDAVNRILKRFSFESWEVYRESRIIRQTLINNHTEQSIRCGTLSGMAVRAVQNGCAGFASCNGLSEDNLEYCAEQTYRTMPVNQIPAAETSFCRSWDVTDIRRYYDPSIDDPEWRKNGNDDLKMSFRNTVKVRTVERSFQDEKIFRHLINSNGADMKSEETLFLQSGKWTLEFIGESIMIEAESSSRFCSGLACSPDIIFHKIPELQACSKTMSGTFTGDLIISPLAAKLWLSIWEKLYRMHHNRHSGCQDDLTRNTLMTVIDDRTLPSAPGSVNFDGEGFPPGRDIIFNKEQNNGGKLKQQTERDEQLMPRPAHGNLYIQNGHQDVPEMIQDVIQGIWIFKFFSVPAESDDYRSAFGFEGFIIRYGELSSFCSGITESLNPYQWLAKLSAVGNDLAINDRVSSPTLKFSDMNLKVH